MRILLVDDHPLYVEGLQNWLTVHGHQVIGAAGDAPTALAYARSGQPELALVDLDLPGNGLEITRCLKAEFPRMVVIILAVSIDSLIVRRALCCGAIGCLPKSASPQTLIGTLSQLDAGLPTNQIMHNKPLSTHSLAPTSGASSI